MRRSNLRGAPSSARFAERTEERFQVALEIASAMVSALCNQRECGARFIDIASGRDTKKRSQIRNILWTCDVISGEHLQGDQVPRRGDTNRQL
jgi:hypothetical protein